MVLAKIRRWASIALAICALVAVGVLAVTGVVLSIRPAAATGSPVGTTVDGFPIGYEVCSTPSASCYEMLTLGRAALDARLPGHPPVVSSGLYRWDVAHSETIDIAVFDLADGRRYAERVICSPSGCRQQ